MAEARITFHPERRGEGTLALTETHWGYILREADGPAGGSAVGDAALRFLGFVLVACAYAQWLLPSTLFDTGGVAGRIGLSAMLAAGGAVLVLIAGRGVGREVQVDTAKREMRLVRRSGRGRVRVLRRLPFDTIESVFLQRRDGQAGEICLRASDDAASLHLLSGAERDLARILSRLQRDMQSPAERVEARMRLAAPRRIAVRAAGRKTA